MRPKGLILGVDTIKASRDRELIRRHRVINDPTDERVNAIAITSQTIDQALIATLGELTPNGTTGTFDAETDQALNRARQENKILDKQELYYLRGNKLAYSFAEAIVVFLRGHGFMLPYEIEDQFESSEHYLDYLHIARTLLGAGISVYFISNGIGPTKHYTWTI